MNVANDGSSSHLALRRARRAPRGSRFRSFRIASSTSFSAARATPGSVSIRWRRVCSSSTALVTDWVSASWIVHRPSRAFLEHERLDRAASTAGVTRSEARACAGMLASRSSFRSGPLVLVPFRLPKGPALTRPGRRRTADRPRSSVGGRAGETSRRVPGSLQSHDRESCSITRSGLILTSLTQGAPDAEAPANVKGAVTWHERWGSTSARRTPWSPCWRPASPSSSRTPRARGRPRPSSASRRTARSWSVRSPSARRSRTPIARSAR